MRYRTKLMLLFSLTAVLLNGIAVGVMYRVAAWHFFNEFRAKAASIAATIAAQLDGDAYRLLQGQSAPETTPEYHAMYEQLRRARDANRRNDTYLKYVFTLHRSTLDPGAVLVGVNPEENPAISSKFGEKYRSTRGIRTASADVVVDEHLFTDEFGEGIAARAPIRNRKGEVVGRLVASFTSERVSAKQRPLVMAGLGTLLLSVSASLLLAWVLASRITRPLAELERTMLCIGKGDLNAKPAIYSKDEFGVVARAVEEMARGLREREKVKSAFARYVSQQVMDTVLVSSSVPDLHGARRRITVLFCDIRGFSTMSEGMRPEDVVELLNEYFERMVEIVFRHQGTLDKFLGDGLMVIFGAPQEDPDQEEHAIRAAIEMQREVGELRKKWQLEGRAQLRVGIGINSGPAIVGNIGSSRRMEYTAIGDTVNVAARLETATKDLGAEILVSEYTFNAVRGAFDLRRMGPIQVKGRGDTVQVYALAGGPEPARECSAAAG